MAVYPIMVSKSAGSFSFNPSLCLIERDQSPSYILFVLDESLSESFSKPKPEFEWDDPKPNQKDPFEAPEVLAGGKILRIKDTHTDAKSAGYWPYGIFFMRSCGDSNKTHKAKKRGKHPVIINR
jgi:hypothetical protein